MGNASSETDHVLSGYWAESRRPFASFLFIVPMLVVYEAGLWWLGPVGIRNGADIWLRQFLEGLGFQHFYLLPALTCGALLGWHHVQRERWGVGGIVLYGMLMECLALGCLLMLFAHFQGALLYWGETAVKARYAVAYLGAGIYEEMLFRMLLVPGIAAVGRVVGAGKGASLLGAVVLASLLFAAAHYQWHIAIGSWRFDSTVGDPFQWTSFLFRAGAGAFFAGLFLYRGFGIAAGTHALYDILATVI